MWKVRIRQAVQVYACAVTKIQQIWSRFRRAIDKVQGIKVVVIFEEKSTAISVWSVLNRVLVDLAIAFIILIVIG